MATDAGGGGAASTQTGGRVEGMSLWQQVGGWYDNATDYVGGGIENVKEWFTGDDEQNAADESAIPGSNGQTGAGQTGGSPVNWTAASVLVGAAGLVMTLLKK
ncbi:hypothetical protein ABMA57_07535 [Saccharospirillum sp. HFRX-1]|uniref:hypothetical protein n=1 Tax=unclassified Saccharospirillum TaxID=2633430 RepID=UPI00371E599A